MTAKSERPGVICQCPEGGRDDINKSHSWYSVSFSCDDEPLDQRPVVPQKVRDYVTNFDPEDLLGSKDPGHSSGPGRPRPFLR